MMLDIKVKNIVLVGNFNPSYFDKYFFIKNGIASEEEILKNSVFNALGVMQLVCDKFSVVINTNQIIISAQHPVHKDVEIDKLMRTLIEAGNLLNLKALGFNFHWFLWDESKSFNELSKELFYNNNNKMFTDIFNTNDSMYGAYVSKDIKESRLKLDIKPVNTPELNAINFQFNFHFEIRDKSTSSEATEYLNDYNFYVDACDKIISIYN